VERNDGNGKDTLTCRIGGSEVRQKSKSAIYNANSRERKRRRVDEMIRNAATQERALLALQDRLHDMHVGHAPVRILAA